MASAVTKWLAVGVFSLMTLPFVILYGSILSPQGALALFWLCMFAVFIFAKWEPEYRGLFFVAVSVGVALLGKAAFGNAGSMEFVYEFIMLVGGGVGGNFIAAGLLKAESARGRA